MINYWQNITNVGNTLRTKHVVYMGLSDAEYMKVIRTELGLTQSEMAKEAGYNSKDAISKIERGKKGLSGPARKCLQYLAELNEIQTP